MKILVTPTSLQADKPSKSLDLLRSFSEDLVFNPHGRPLKEDELIPLLQDCDAYVAGLDFITEKVIRNAPKLKVISRYGAGYDRVDVAAATAQNVVVCNTPGVNAEAVGELAFSLILSCARNIPYLNRQTKAGEWVRSQGMELYGKSIGILGLGAIGRVLARCAAGFGMKVLAYDPYINESYCKEHNILVCTFEEVLCQADVLSLHLPLNEETRHLIDADALSKMKPSSILINTSRGGLIDEEAAYVALREGKLRGLGLDAFEVEPPVNSPLFTLDNVVLTPHTGAHTVEATALMAERSIENLIQVLKKEECPYVVNREIYKSEC